VPKLTLQNFTPIEPIAFSQRPSHSKLLAYRHNSTREIWLLKLFTSEYTEPEGRQTMNAYFSGVEAVMADVYRLIAGCEHAPEYRVVYDDGCENVIGVMTCYEENFKPLWPESYDLRELTQAGLAELLVISYVFAEFDLNVNNIGTVSYGPGHLKLIKFDHDKCLWITTDKVYQNFNFLLTNADIKTFPIVNIFSPYNWLYWSRDNKQDSEVDGVFACSPKRVCQRLFAIAQVLSENEAFVHKKYKTLIKIAKLPRSVWKTLVDENVEHRDMNKDIYDAIIKRVSALQEVLQNEPIAKHYTSISNTEIIDELMVYNSTMDSLGQEDKKVKLNELQLNSTIFQVFSNDDEYS
tara:strand:- start:14162 stop:15214 length:1053 start_codon:yes stop_codon:yes gene_type:complete